MLTKPWQVGVSFESRWNNNYNNNNNPTLADDSKTWAEAATEKLKEGKYLS